MEPVVEVVPSGAVLADVRWRLDGSGWEAYQASHIPGAVFVDLDSCLAAPPSAAEGRHPLPAPEDFARCMAGLGIGDGTVVVAYDDVGGAVAARLVWMLRALGEFAALLDGRLAAWTGGREGGEGSRPFSSPAAGGFTARPWPLDWLVSIDEVASGEVMVLDVRAPERYRGEVEPVDRVAGHIPGAVNLPTVGNLDPQTGRILAPELLRARLAVAEGAAVHCGSGVNACHTLLAMEQAGVPGGRLYVGSWSQWSSDPHRPIAAG